MAGAFSIFGSLFLSDRASATLKKVDKGIARLQSNSQRFGEGVRGVSQGVFAIGAAATAASIPINKSIGIAGGFEFQMAKVKSITKGTAAELASMEGAVKFVGLTTSKSALQAASALELISQAGFDAKDSISLLPKVVTLSEAGSLDLASATSILTSSTRALAGSFEGTLNITERAAQLTDLMAFSQANSNTTILKLGKTFELVAPAIAGLNIPIEQVTAGISALSNRGLGATRSGTSLAAMYDRLLKPTKSMAKELLSLGLLDGKGSRITKIKDLPINDLPQLLRTLSTGINKIVNPNVKAGFIARMFGTRGRRAFSSLVAEGADEIERFANEAKGAVGFAKEVAIQRLDNFIGQWIILKSAVESFAIEVGNTFIKGDKGLVPILKAVTNRVREFAAAFSFANGNLDAFGENKSLTDKQLELIAFAGGFQKGVEDGIDALKRFGKQVEEFFGIFRGEGEDANRSLGELVGKFLTFSIVLGPAFLGIAAMGLALGGLSNAVRGVLQIFIALGGGKVLAGLISIGKVIWANNVGTRVLAFSWGLVKKSILLASRAMLAFLASPVMLPVISLLAIATMLILIARNWDRAKEAGRSFIDEITRVATDFASNALGMIGSALKFVFIDVLWEGVKLAGSTLLNGLKLIGNLLTGDMEGVKQNLMDIWSDFGGFFDKLFSDSLPNLAKNFGKSLINFVLAPAKLIMSFIKNMLSFLADISNDAFPGMSKFLDERVKNFDKLVNEDTGANVVKLFENRNKGSEFQSRDLPFDLEKRVGLSALNQTALTQSGAVPSTPAVENQSVQQPPIYLTLQNVTTLDGEVISRSVAKRSVENSQRRGVTLPDDGKGLIINNGIFATGVP